MTDKDRDLVRSLITAAIRTTVDEIEMAQKAGKPISASLIKTKVDIAMNGVIDGLKYLPK